MAFNVAAPAVEVPLNSFGSLVTEQNPSDLPDGVSPDNQELEFVPGSCHSRRGLNSVFVSPVTGRSFNYAKSYVDPTKVKRNIYLDDAGVLWVENVTTNPGVLAQIAQTTPAALAKSITAFGREYIAISDGLHGVDVPLQFDGTNLDRVTQDGPGAPPNIASFEIPSVSMALGTPPGTLTIAGIFPFNKVDGFYTQLGIYTTVTADPSIVGQNVVISGTGTGFDGTGGVVTDLASDGAVQISAFWPSSTTSYTGTGTLTIGSGMSTKTLQRQSNVVTAYTATDHHLQVGYQAQISGMDAAVVGTSIASIKINNSDNPGIAVVETTDPHGIYPGSFVTLKDIPGVVVGGTISTIARAGQIVTAVMSANHNLTPGSVVTLAGVTDASFDTTFVVAQVSGPTTFVCFQADTDATSSGGTVSLKWPIPDSPTPQQFQVISAPTPTTFQVEVNYANGTWTGGSVLFAWDGLFNVSAVLSPTSFQYQQYGPDATTTQVGTISPNGRAAPGKHQMQVMFQTRQGYITAPSPPVTFVANGGQYLNVSNIPIGPDNVVARILVFTGAGGSYFYYIPVPGQENGQLVSTSTVLNDNSTTTAVLDFSDNTLFAATAIFIPGNTVANQITLDGALGFAFYAGRLVTYGQRNRIQNLLNMGFDGGYLPNNPTIPTGWVNTDGTGALTTAGRFGFGWQMNASGAGKFGELSQSFYQTYSGSPIATPLAPYRLRCWLNTSEYSPSMRFVANITSVSTSFLSVATVPGSQIVEGGAWVEVAFNAAMPSQIPSDLTLSIFATGATANVVVDELSIIYAETPYLDTILYGSYTNNPEAFDGVSGKFGSDDDPHKVMDLGVIRQTFYMLTQEPSGRIHGTIANGVSEPAGWSVNEVAANCGALSAFSVTRSQADDTTASGGEEWFAWASLSGARIFSGNDPWKISQEIQPDWQSINKAAYLRVWSVNDSVDRVIYFGLPTGTNATPNIIYPVNYRELDTAEQIAAAAPVHVSVTSGKLHALETARKWTRWNLAMNGAALMYHDDSTTTLTFLNGAKTGQVYTLSALKLADDDYGQIRDWYVTHFFPSAEQAAAYGLGNHRLELAYTTAQFSGVGKVKVTGYQNTLSNPWYLTVTRDLQADPAFDFEWGGANLTAQRMAFKFEGLPADGINNALTIQKFVPSIRQNAHMPVRGSSR